MAEEMMKNFNALPSNDRSNALQKLVKTLNADERQVLSAAISNKNDFIAELPFEIIVHVFSYLDVLASWTLQRVCKRWQKLLSSKDFMLSIVADWNTHDPSDSARSVAETVNDSFITKIRHVQALRLRRPFTITVLNDTGVDLEGPNVILSRNKVELEGKRLTYVSSQRGEGDSLVVHDLANGDVRTLRGEAREGIIFLILTSDLVAFTNLEGILYVSRFSEPRKEPSRTQLPSARVRGSGGHGDIVALAYDRPGSASLSEVILYNAKTRSTSSLWIEDEFARLEGQVLKLNSIGVLVDSDKQVIDIFSLTLKTHLQLLHIRISFDGKVLCSDRRSESITGCREHRFTIGNPVPTGYRNQYRVQIFFYAPYVGQPALRQKCDVLFDAAHGKFWDNSDLAASRPPLECLWKSQHHRPPATDKPWLETVVLMNDSFMASLELMRTEPRSSRIRVFCYDQSIHMKNAASTGLWPDHNQETVDESHEAEDDSRETWDDSRETWDDSYVR